MRNLLENVAAHAGGWIELRYQARTARRIVARNGTLEESSSHRSLGVGVRAWEDGVFGFASTTDLTEAGIRKAVLAARDAAKTSAQAKKVRVHTLAPARMAKGTFPVETDDPLDNHSLEEKLCLVLKQDGFIRSAHPSIISSSVSYSEVQDERVVVTSDGASVHLFDAKPDIRFLAVAHRDDDQTMGLESSAVAGGWSDLFAERSAEEMAERAVRLAVDQLDAPYASGGSAQVVLNPELVGVLSHEAIGHTVEADFVLGGAITSEKMDVRVASDLVTLCDSGASPYAPHAVGTLPVDDEGVVCQRVVIIDQGVLRAYLHNRETAGVFDAVPAGNARAYTHQDFPIIRMRNTYIEPGETPAEDVFAGIQQGYYLCGLGMSGQADANAEFMFGVREARRITDGRVGGIVRGVTISGNAFDVLQSVDAVGNDFAWDNVAGYCGKGQPAKVAAGGPHLRCRLTLGGRQ